MFKIAKLKNAEETVTIRLNPIEQYKYEKDKTFCKSFDTLEFEIIGKIGKDEYTLSFELNCRLKELLKLPDGEMVDFNSYILDEKLGLIRMD